MPLSLRSANPGSVYRLLFRRVAGVFISLMMAFAGCEIAVAASAQETPPSGETETKYADMFDPKGAEVSEENFKETIRKAGFVWVMYEYTGENANPRIEKNGRNFWKVLKENYGNQVDGFIKIDYTDWSNTFEKAKQEIGTSATPAFILYDSGKIVNDGTFAELIILGAPVEGRLQTHLDRIDRNSSLQSGERF